MCIPRGLHDYFCTLLAWSEYAGHHDESLARKSVYWQLVTGCKSRVRTQHPLSPKPIVVRSVVVSCSSCSLVPRLSPPLVFWLRDLGDNPATGLVRCTQLCFRWFINLFLTFSRVQSSPLQWLVTPKIIAKHEWSKLKKLCYHSDGCQLDSKLSQWCREENQWPCMMMANNCAFINFVTTWWLQYTKHCDWSGPSAIVLKNSCRASAACIDASLLIRTRCGRNCPRLLLASLQWDYS